MKKFLVVALIMGLAIALCAAGALAKTDLWSFVTNTGGYTEFHEITTVSGWDWSEGLGPVLSCDGSDPWVRPSLEVTAVVDEAVLNYGSLYFEKAMTSDASWDLEEYKFMSGDGDTEIFKTVTVWTEDSRFNCAGDLWYPTEAWVETEFRTETFYDAEGAYFWMDMREAQDDIAGYAGNIAQFNKVIVVDEPYTFAEKVGINDFPSDYDPPDPPDPPDPHML